MFPHIFLRSAMTFLATALLSGCAAVPRSPALPSIDLTLAPHSADGHVDHVDLTLRLERPNLPAGGRLVQSPLVIVSIPGQRFDGGALAAHDARGALPLTVVDEPPTPTQALRRWLVARATVGDVTIRARAVPRKVDATTRNGPLFDLREEEGNVYGAGMTFVPVPDSEVRHRLRVRWNLDAMPPGSRGVWSLGEGDVEVIDTPGTLNTTFYAAGPMFRHPTAGAERFSLYWFSKPPFDAPAVGTSIESFYRFAARFFDDEAGSYRVFIRRNAFRGNGGTALRSSFMFGWGTGRPQTTEELQGLLAHEITHNWPRLDGAEHGETAWYTEGMAEYYSILLSRRAGAIDDAEYLRRINERALGYYTNPYRGSTNQEAAKKFWVDARAQRVPYGRGFMYFAKLDAQLRAASAGRRSLDDLVLEVLRRQRGGEAVGLEQWVQMVARELGDAARADFEAMVAGREIVPPASSLAPCLAFERYTARPFELGFDDFVLGKVTRLVAGSAAAAAGLQEDDEILELTDLSLLQRDESREMRMKIRRAGEVREVRYQPRGAAVDGGRWVATNAPLSGCRY